jgi:hypothetical protein
LSQAATRWPHLGVNDRVYQINWNGSAYSAWTYVGGTTMDAPAVVSRVTNTMDLFIRSTNDQIYWRTFDGAHWTDYRVLPGAVDSGPAATTDSAGNIYSSPARAGTSRSTSTTARRGAAGRRSIRRRRRRRRARPRRARWARGRAPCGSGIARG